MHDPAPLGDDIAEFGLDPGADEIGAALLVGRALAQDFDAPRCRADLEALADDCPQSCDPWTYLADLGFSGSRDDHGAVNNSRLDWVLDKRQGIPISLGVLLIHIAKRTGREAVGINFPGHFLVRVGGQLVDPFSMTTTSERECLKQFAPAEQASVQTPLGMFQEAAPKVILLRMLNNVKYQYASMAEWDRALDMLDWQLRIEPNSAQLYLERGELWNRLGGMTGARGAYERVLQLTDDAQLRAAAQSRLANLRADEPIH
jgi:regulator of sirC expression with transglutaminase-like and TPR domain